MFGRRLAFYLSFICKKQRSSCEFQIFYSDIGVGRVQMGDDHAGARRVGVMSFAYICNGGLGDGNYAAGYTPRRFTSQRNLSHQDCSLRLTNARCPLIPLPVGNSHPRRLLFAPSLTGKKELRESKPNVAFRPMRFLTALLMFIAAITGRLSAQGNSDPITTTGTIPSQSASTAVGTPAIDLRTYFAVPTITGQVVQFTANGTSVFNVEMNSAAAPNTVANFLSYVNSNRFTNSIIHRTDKSLGIIQGGGFYNRTATATTLATVGIASDAPIALETADTLPNNRGTIAMARNTPDSATTGWFINQANNSVNLPPASNSGYAVFGRVTGTGMNLVDAIFNLPVLGGNVIVQSATTSSPLITIDSVTPGALPANFGADWTLLGSFVQSRSGNFVTLAGNPNQTISTSTTVPYFLLLSPYTLINVANGQYPFSQLPVLTQLASAGSPLQLSDLISINSIQTVPVFPTPAAPGGPSVVTFSASSTNPDIRATINGSFLNIVATKNQNGNATVTVTATDTNGNAVQQTPFNVNVTRKVVDFNSDGIADLVFQNNAGQIANWRLNANGTLASTAYLFTGTLGDWKVVATADMDGDGIPDLLFQNNIGQIAVWYLNASGATTSTAYIFSGTLGDWRVVATADINRDGKTDIIFQNSFGQIAVWYMNGSGAATSTAYLYTGGTGDWRVKCAADLNGDGIADLIFQNNAGQTSVWNLNGSGATTSTAYISASVLGDWRVAGTADINGDGIPDLLFQNNIGQIAVWYMNGSGATTSTPYLYTGTLGDWRLR